MRRCEQLPWENDADTEYGQNIRLVIKVNALHQKPYAILGIVVIPCASYSDLPHWKVIIKAVLKLQNPIARNWWNEFCHCQNVVNIASGDTIFVLCIQARNTELAPSLSEDRQCRCTLTDNSRLRNGNMPWSAICKSQGADTQVPDDNSKQ